MGNSPVSIGNDARRVRRGAVVTVAWPARPADPPARLPAARHPRGAMLSADGQNEHARVKPGLYFSTISHRMERTGRKAIGRSPY